MIWPLFSPLINSFNYFKLPANAEKFNTPMLRLDFNTWNFLTQNKHIIAPIENGHIELQYPNRIHWILFRWLHQIEKIFRVISSFQNPNQKCFEKMLIDWACQHHAKLCRELKLYEGCIEPNVNFLQNYCDIQCNIPLIHATTCCSFL